MMFLLLFLVIAGTCSASRILAVFPMDYKSHFTLASALVKELADRGHEVTLISLHELKYTNVNSVVLSNHPEGQKSHSKNYQAFLICF
jgi:menaquinone-dependent protoporphyrinogen IX oxidase